MVFELRSILKVALDFDYYEEQGYNRTLLLRL